MNRQDQIGLLKRLLNYVDTKTTAMADAPWRTDDYAGVPVLIVRGREGKLRAFLNVCRHRGAKVAEGCGEARLFVCPYHAWTYELTGKVRGIPDERCFPDVRDERSSLAELPLCEKHGLVWVIPTPADDAAADSRPGAPALGGARCGHLGVPWSPEALRIFAGHVLAGA